MTKVIAMYLPQYHEIPENSMFWGEGYTDWVAVKKSKPLFDGHNQPRIPMNDNYYDLSKKENIKWQAKIAKENGVYGFGIYHYWFNSNKHLLGTPAEIILDNKDINIPFLFCWDNASWRRTWSNVKIGNDWAPLYDNKTNAQTGILAELRYGNEEDWLIHFEYLNKFFQDDRYIKIDNKPVFCILNQDNETDTLAEMCHFWNEYAIKCGYDGIYFIGKKKNNNVSFTEHSFTYEPEWSGWTWHNQYERVLNKITKSIKKCIKKECFYSYDRIWKRIINNEVKNSNPMQFSGAFVAYDDSPRRGIKGKIVLGSTPEKFYEYMTKLLMLCKKNGKEFVFLVAWNEWGEGAYLEPDTSDKMMYLNALNRAVKNSNR